MAAEPLRIQQIRQFVITATSGSFRAAATGTFRSQAAVSAAMRHLERQVGGKLFEDGRRAKLTPLAQSLYPIFQDLLATHDRAVTDVRQLALAERGSVSLAVIPFLSEEWLSSLLIEFGSSHPHITSAPRINGRTKSGASWPKAPSISELQAGCRTIRS
jgi:DNA-binding transcriptional LysR family regulator